MKLSEYFKFLWTGFIKSYSIIFFARSNILAFIIILITFVDYTTGICGALSVLISLICVNIFGFDKNKAVQGLYGFNSLLVGLGLGYYFNLNFQLIIVVIIASIIALAFTLIIEAVFYKYSLHFLSIPFLFAFWIVIIASYSFESIEPSNRGIFIYNTIFRLGGYKLFQITNYINSINYLPSLKLYFNSLSSIFFIYSTAGGILISLGLLVYSRIAFILSILGFYSAMLAYNILGIPVNEITFAYVGFNYILLAIAAGAYFVIPTRISLLNTVLLVFISVILTVSLTRILGLWKIHIYSLSFNLVTISYIYLIKLRLNRGKWISLSPLIYDTPEKNLYNYLNNVTRFKNKTFISLKLPFLGEWFVSQGQEGNITHRDKWKYAWDFELKDSNNKSFKNNGSRLEDYYCYNKVILSPADGIIEEVFDGIRDNKIGDINLENNWGNSVIIKLADYFYCQLSHLKEGSIKVKRGDAVRSGQIIALCGNSGRSPSPHLHLQLQTEPELGSGTVKYPIGQFLIRMDEGFRFKNYEIPAEGEYISNHTKNSFISDAFTFKEDHVIDVSTIVGGKEVNEKWKVIIDFYNNYYFESSNRKAKAYFKVENDIFYFLDYKGSKKSLLYLFYLSSYKIPLGFYDNLNMDDSVSVYDIFPKLVLLIQDTIAPLYLFLSSQFNLNYAYIDNHIAPETVKLSSRVYKKYFNAEFEDADEIYRFNIEIKNGKISSIESICHNLTCNIKCSHSE